MAESGAPDNRNARLLALPEIACAESPRIAAAVAQIDDVDRAVLVCAYDVAVTTGPDGWPATSMFTDADGFDVLISNNTHCENGTRREPSNPSVQSAYHRRSRRRV